MEKHPSLYLGTTNPKTFMKQLFLFIAVSLFIGCSEPIVYPPGGYDYPKEVKGDDTNFYYLPIKNILSRKDSFRTAQGYRFYRAVSEPNLSMIPMENETFRVSYFTAFGEFIIVSLYANIITVKKGNAFEIYDENKSTLSITENYHLGFLSENFPVDTTGKSNRKKKYLDSMTRLFPELLDVNYYKQLSIKQNVLNSQFSYQTRKTIISQTAFHSLITDLNASGFWLLPYEQKESCGGRDEATDGDGFTFEANTKTKYQIVTYSDCYDTTRFAKACQKLFNLAGLGKELIYYSGNDKSN